MIRFSYAKDVASALAGADKLAVIGSASMWSDDGFPPKLFRASIKNALLEVAKDVSAGALGATGSTLRRGDPGKVAAGVLSDDLSRMNSPARPDGICKCVRSAGLGDVKKAALVLVLDSADHLTAAFNAVGRAFPMYNAKTGKKKNARIQLIAVGRDGKVIETTAMARHTMESAREAARLVDTPPTDLNPGNFAEQVKSLLAKIDHVEITEYVGDELVENKLMGIHSVGRCAMSAPRMLVASYNPPDATGAHVALVGKGVTFDTGGLHLKTRGFMEGMKCDMGGAAAVTGAFRVLTKTGVARKISLVVCMAENAIGANSYKPDDVLRMHSGKTVEINNTDAEGRLLLADGVSWAARVLRAKVIFDAATLTGAQMIATGSHFSGVVSNDAGVEQALVSAGRDSGDLAHALPFAPEFFKAEFKSPIADMRNSVKNRLNAQSSCATQFVYNHIEDRKVRWGHVDLAGPAFRGDRGTGYGVALLAEAVNRLD